jgi:hypothetical protein
MQSHYYPGVDCLYENIFFAVHKNCSAMHKIENSERPSYIDAEYFICSIDIFANTACNVIYTYSVCLSLHCPGTYSALRTP